MKVVIWNENYHEKIQPIVTENYPGGIHEYLKSVLACDEVEVTTATLDDPECGLTDELLDTILAVASGKPTKNEENGYREIAIFKDGVTL